MSWRSLARGVLGAVFALIAIGELWQIAMAATGMSDEPFLVAALQLAIGIASGSTAWSIWRDRVWAPIAAAATGVIAFGLLASLPALLHLEAAARTGIWTSAVAFLVFTLGTAWFLRIAPRIS
jgi:hypothetical protein